MLIMLCMLVGVYVGMCDHVWMIIVEARCQVEYTCKNKSKKNCWLDHLHMC